MLQSRIYTELVSIGAIKDGIAWNGTSEIDGLRTLSCSPYWHPSMAMHETAFALAMTQILEHDCDFYFDPEIVIVCCAAKRTANVWSLLQMSQQKFYRASAEWKTQEVGSGPDLNVLLIDWLETLKAVGHRFRPV